ncbi:PAS domain-containing protein [Archangium violaceum]|uniref:PAS domain-containing protein n=1 Tax=Archangium violaceum TaxID=83451 RepID=UPI001951FE7E|nr:PAS domain-containing protein [Archangium violaceum]QRN93694.1 PAS domain-containing protein [Archangium violaceum]
MPPPAPKRDEAQRLLALERSSLLDTPPEPDFDDIVRLAAELCGTPIALVSLVDRSRQWFKANVGLSGVSETERGISFCTHAIEREGVFLVEDARADERFAFSPLVQGEPFIRFYAGAAILTEEGHALGTLCVIDRRPRTLSEAQRRGLLGLKRQVELQIHLRTQLRVAQERNAELEQSQERMRSLNSYLQMEMRERQRMERQMQDQQTLISSVLAHIPHSVFWKDRDSVFLGCNHQFARDMGVSSPEEVIGRTDLEMPYLTRELADLFRRGDREVMESGVPHLGYEETIRTPDGRESWVMTSKVPLKNPDGTVRGVLGIYIDLSERRRQENVLQEAKRLVEQHAAHLEAQVQEAQARTRQLMEYSGDAVFLLDDKGRVKEVNPVAERLLGLSREQLVGTFFELLAPENEREALRRALSDLRVRGTVRLSEQGLRSAAAGRVAFDISASLQVAGADRLLLVVGHDLTEKRRLEQQTLQNDRLASMGALAAGIAHEINNPTSYVLSNLSFLQEWRDELEKDLSAPGALPPRLVEMLSEAKDVIAESLDGGRRIRDIVRDMRFFSHTAGEDLAPVDVHACLDFVLRMAHNALKHAAEVRKEYEEGLPPVLASEGRLSQVFLNLVVNAAQAMRPEASRRHVLGVRTSREEEWVRIDISDTGHGIPPEVLPRIFDPFFTTKAVGSGSGLGLSISLSLIQKMDGDLRVRSEPGVGTTFTLLLPTREKDDPDT